MGKESLKNTYETLKHGDKQENKYLYDRVDRRSLQLTDLMVLLRSVARGDWTKLI